MQGPSGGNFGKTTEGSEEPEGGKERGSSQTHETRQVAVGRAGNAADEATKTRREKEKMGREGHEMVEGRAVARDAPLTPPKNRRGQEKDANSRPCEVDQQDACAWRRRPGYQRYLGFVLGNVGTCVARPLSASKWPRAIGTSVMPHGPEECLTFCRSA